MAGPKATYVEASSGSRHLITTAVVAGLVIMLGAVYSYGLAMRSVSERSQASVIEGERRAFCVGLGLADKSEPYARCITGLTAIQQRQRERFEAESAGIL
jgi:hypothetical protein